MVTTITSPFFNNGVGSNKALPPVVKPPPWIHTITARPLCLFWFFFWASLKTFRDRQSSLPKEPQPRSADLNGVATFGRYQRRRFSPLFRCPALVVEAHHRTA